MHFMARAKTNPWLYGGLVGLPTLLLFLVCAVLFGSDHETGMIPAWACFAASLCVPLTATIAGSGLAYFLSDWKEQMSGRQLTNLYTTLFTLLWNVVFGYLSFFTFAMGMGDGPAASSLAEFGNRLLAVVAFGMPATTLIALVVCLVVTALVAGVLETLFPQIDRSCS